MEEEEDFFIIEGALNEADSLPPSMPANRKHHKVIGALSKKSTGEGFNLSIVRDGAVKFGIKETMRELLANVFDQVARSNGSVEKPSFNDIYIVTGKRRNGHDTEEVIAFHNGKNKLAEIIHIRDPRSEKFENKYFASKNYEHNVPFGTLTFINYGVVIKKPNQVLAFGNSDKRDKLNQTGMHGEGLKYAISACLNHGCGIDIFCSVLKDDRPEYQRWRFYLQQGGFNDENVHCTPTFPNPRPIIRGNNSQFNDSNHFMVRITYNKVGYEDHDGHEIPGRPNGLGFDLDTFLVPRQFIRSIRDENDFGALIELPEVRGTIYIWHFNVCNNKKKHLRWSYDLFIPVTRGRDVVDYQKLLKSMTNIWSSILETREHQEFFDEILMGPPSEYFEQRILGGLSDGARKTLIRMFRRKYPLTYPVGAKDLNRFKMLFDREHMVIPTHAESTLLLNASLDQIIETEKANLIKAVQNGAFQWITDIFPEIIVVESPSALKYTRYGELIILNCNYLQKLESTNHVINYIMFHVLPNENVNTLPIVMRLFQKEKEKEGEFINIPLEDESAPEEGTHPPRKRQASEEIEKEGPTKLPTPPEGMMWAKVDALINKL